MPDTGSLTLTVTRDWYDHRCSDREQFYMLLRGKWRGWTQDPAVNLVLYDQVGIEVATFRLFRNDPKVRGCPS